MSANSIRRSDDNIEERYKKIAKAISKNNTRSQFGEFGQAASLNASDSSLMPVFTSNYINFSNFEEKGEQKTASLENNYLKERSEKRRIIAGIDDIDLEDFDKDFSDDEEINIDDILEDEDEDEDIIECPYCGGFNCKVLPVPPEVKVKVCKCEDCGKKFTAGERRKIEEIDKEYVDPSIEEELPFAFKKGPRRIKQEDIFDENEDYNSMPDVISSIEAMLPAVMANPNKKMNKMAGGIIKNLIGLLDIEKNQKQWFNSQVDSGILNSEIFVRNIKSSLRDGGK